MSGNVFEWVWDPWDKAAYQRGDVRDPVSSKNSRGRLFRGGGSLYEPLYCRVSFRGRYIATRRDPSQGFRFLRNA